VSSDELVWLTVLVTVVVAVREATFDALDDDEPPQAATATATAIASAASADARPLGDFVVFPGLEVRIAMP
jgi:hypothetical protein